MTADLVSKRMDRTNGLQYQYRSGAFVLAMFEFRALFVKRPLQPPENTVVSFIFIQVVVPQYNRPRLAPCCMGLFWSDPMNSMIKNISYPPGTSTTKAST